MDIVFIEGLNIDTTIGVFDWEKEIKQRLVIDLSMANDNRIPAQQDDLSKTLDYAEISVAIDKFANANPVELIETLAERLANYLMSEYSLPWLRLKVTKPGAVENAAGVGVIIERGEKG